MKKFLVLLTSISLATVVSTNVVACIPQPKNGNDAIGDKLDLSLFAFDKMQNNKFSLKKDNVIVNDQINLESGITKGIQNIIPIYLPWNEVDVTVTIGKTPATFKQVYLKIQAKDGAKSIKGSVMWGNLEATPKAYVDLRPNIKDWQPEGQRTSKVKAEGELETAAFNALGGHALGKSDLAGIGLRGTYDKDTNTFTVTADGATSEFFVTSDLVFNTVIN